LGAKCKILLNNLNIDLQNIASENTSSPPWIPPKSRQVKSYQQIYINEITKRIKQKIYEKTNLLWKNISPNANKLRLIKPEIKKWKTSHRECRREEVVLCRVRIGHSNLTHLSLITEKHLPICESCKTILSIKHILTECSIYHAYRPVDYSGENLPKVLGDDENSVLNLLNFLKQIKLYKSI